MQVRGTLRGAPRCLGRCQLRHTNKAKYITLTNRGCPEARKVIRAADAVGFPLQPDPSPLVDLREVAPDGEGLVELVPSDALQEGDVC